MDVREKNLRELIADRIRATEGIDRVEVIATEFIDKETRGGAFDACTVLLGPAAAGLDIHIREAAYNAVCAALTVTVHAKLQWIEPSDQQREEYGLLVLEEYLEAVRERHSYTVSESRVCDAAMQLGRVRSQRAIMPLIASLLHLTMDDSRSVCQNVLVAIGQPALEAIAATLDGRPTLDGHRVRSDGMGRSHLLKAKERIATGSPSGIHMNGVDVVDRQELPEPG